MPGLLIDWTSLELAFESHVPDQRCFLDRRTGALRFLGANESASEPASEPANQPANEPANQPANEPANQPASQPGDSLDQHLLRVDPVPSREQYRMMERFIATVTNTALKDALQDAIVGKGAFRRFKDAVGRHPEERKRWFAFRDALLHRHILDWLKDARIELQEMPAWNLEPPMTPAPESSPTTPLASAEGAPIVDVEPDRAPDAPADRGHERNDAEALRSYLLAWARAHGEEYRYLFGPAAFARLASDLSQEFIVYRKRS